MELTFPYRRIPRADDILNQENYMTSTWREVFLAAHQRGASDIHVEPNQPEDGSLLIRFRVHGELTVFRKIVDAENQQSYLNKLEAICSLDPTEKRTRQDRSFLLTQTESRYRVSLVPATSFDLESIVLRIIRMGDLPKLSDCGLRSEAVADLLHAMESPQGMILVTGPTGSGKSTTLQGSLMAYPREKKSVSTLEEPIERKIPYVRHNEISPKFSWVEGIKALLRQDPDAILIGEIRDSESAKLAFEAANTGHLVFSTLHTNGVADTFERLLKFGVEKEAVYKTLVFCAAQRLVKTLCLSCRVPRHGSTHFRRGAGCSSCSGKIPGISGRRPILEYCLKLNHEDITKFEHTAILPLKATLSGELKRLVDDGLVDVEELGAY